MKTTEMGRRISLEEGLGILEEGIVKAKMILDGYPTNALFTAAEYMKYYDCVYFMCIQYHPSNYSAHLYQRFERALKESISSKVLPSLQDKNDASLLIELTNMWAKYKVMAKCLGGFFLYLDRHEKIDASLNDASVRCFHDLVFNAHYHKFHDAAILLINQDRSKNSIDRDLLNNAMAFFVEIGGGKNTNYYDNLEKAILADAANYYSRLASEWLARNSSVDYIKKAEWCLDNELQRVSQYLHQTTVKKLLQSLQVVQWHLMDQTASQLIERQKLENVDATTYQELLSGCANMNLGDETSASPSQQCPMSQ
ncbi:cullin-1-like isoform X4 [Camellia sinensis]|uniref:cullin-1-like isoform X4 n=1 Tax=Camellia sinensis TaxID=4442 RepID=UPI0010357837|nr:cullin-1-like isoform X4 [Camellia sinensis]